jgi:hypothetical protein
MGRQSRGNHIERARFIELIHTNGFDIPDRAGDIGGRQ